MTGIFFEESLAVGALQPHKGTANNAASKTKDFNMKLTNL
jgi:hypothetical protein